MRDFPPFPPMPPDPSELFRVLGVKSRLQILRLLSKHGALGSQRIAEILKISTAAVSQHLKVLKQAGLVVDERQGYRIPYHLNRKNMRHYRRHFIKVLAFRGKHEESCCCEPPEPLLETDDLNELERYRGDLIRHLAEVEEQIRELQKKRGDQV